MRCKITLQERLKDLRVAHNLNLEELSSLTGISKSALGNYENDDYKEINHGNLVILAKFYNVSTDYLLCLTENKNHPNTELTDLHLSDNMVDLLKTGAINNRLLCEIATHDKFVRAKIVNQNPDVDTDHVLRTIVASQIKEEDFFCHITHKTWDTILKDIRKNHEHDIENTPDSNNNSKLVSELSQIMRTSNNSIDTFIEIFCNSFQIKYKKLSEDDKNHLRKLFKKSPLIKNSGINFRRKK